MPGSMRCSMTHRCISRTTFTVTVVLCKSVDQFRNAVISRTMS